MATAPNGTGGSGSHSADDRVAHRRLRARPDPARYAPSVAHYLFNLSAGDRQEAVALLRAKLWGVGSDEPHRDDLAPGDVALIYLGAPVGAFIGRVELATAVRGWTPSEAQVCRGDSAGVSLSDVELWDRPVPMAAVLARVDPAASNPRVQANATAGFGMGVVRITDDEYEAAVTASREYQGRS